MAPADDNGPMGMELRDERKVVTVLFADLVGSTVLGERLDPEELRLVVGGAYRRVGEVAGTCWRRFRFEEAVDGR